MEALLDLGHPRAKCERALSVAGGDAAAAAAFLDANAGKPDEFWAMDEHAWRQAQRGHASRQGGPP
jgi:hypothetical protein